MHLKLLFLRSSQLRRQQIYFVLQNNCDWLQRLSLNLSSILHTKKLLFLGKLTCSDKEANLN